MSMSGNTSEQVRALLRRHRIKPSKGLAQNLLVDDGVYERIVQAAEPTASDHVLEVGPGLGLLTRRLCQAAGSVTAVELDARMISALRSELADCANLTLVEGDILELDPASLHRDATSAYKVAANLPYYITSAVLRHLLAGERRPELMVLMVQYEVAQRLTAQPGQLSLLALSVQVYGTTELICRVPRSAFVPEPNVASAVVRFRAYEQPRIAPDRLALFFCLVKAGFGQRRKQLHNSLAAGMHLEAALVAQQLVRAGIEPTRRAETLSLPEWDALTQVWREELEP